MQELDEKSREFLVFLFLKYPNGLPKGEKHTFTTDKVWLEEIRPRVDSKFSVISTVFASADEREKYYVDGRSGSKWYSCARGITEEGLKVIKEMSDA